MGTRLMGTFFTLMASFSFNRCDNAVIVIVDVDAVVIVVVVVVVLSSFIFYSSLYFVGCEIQSKNELIVFL